MSQQRTFNCAYCGRVNTTTNPRKMFCNKQHADNSRNLVRPLNLKPGEDGGIELQHFSRFPREVKQQVLRGEAGHSIAMYDLECTSLKPNVGRILCASIKPFEEDVYTLSALDRPYKRPDVYDDGALAVAIRDELERYDIIVGWNSKDFDTKFLNSRLLRVGERTKTRQYQLDGKWSFKSKSSAWASLDTVQKFLLPGSREKTEIEWHKWMRALGWDRKLREEAMDEIIGHCERDVEVLEDVYRLLVDADVFRSIRLDGGIL